MKTTRLALVLAITTSLIATPGIAASLTMLQFGSFETRDEAQKRLDEVKSKHSAQIGTLPTSIREVKLPPDNLTVYRTQAGPVANRTAAQGICAQLASSGDECYIVQTAMVAGAADAVAAAATPVTAPIASALNEAKADATPDLTSKLTTLQSLPARDASSREALSSITTPSLETPPMLPAAAAPAPVSEPVVAAEPSPEMKAALNKAIADEANVHENLSKATATDTTPKAERGFWSRLNPFSSSAPAPAKPAAPAPEAKAAPVEAVSVAAMEPVTPAAPAMVANIEPSPLPKSAPVSPAMAVAPLPVITQPEPMRLPPPPAPLLARDREQLAAMAQNPVRPEPIATGSITPVTPVVPAPPTVAPAAGTVNVEEAKRVPVTEAAAAPIVMTQPVVLQPLQPPVPLSPSATDGMKTVWAQVGPVADSNSAMNFWANYRQTHPDFPVVRVRVTNPLQQQLHGANQTWLRVGPVTRVAFVNNLCASMPQNSGLRCGTVMDLGVSSNPQTAKSGLLSGSRYKR